MTILKLVSSVLRLLTAYFELKNRSLYFDLLRDSEKTQDGLIQEIEYLREKGTEEATLTADFLRKRLHREKDLYEKIILNDPDGDNGAGKL